MNLIRKIVILPIKAYKYFLSPLFPNRCRFYPSCSSYAQEAVMVHGVFWGGLFAIWRILRCNPWNPGGVDPVPPARKSLLKNKIE